MHYRWPFIALFIIGAACGDDAGAADAGADAPVPSEDWSRDILHTDLSFDLTSQQASATITIAAAASHAASFEIGDLTITAVYGDNGPLPYDAAAGRLDVVVARDREVELTVDYEFAYHSDFDGADSDFTLLWPYFCGNLFPCKSAPDDGLRFALELTGIPAEETAIFPAIIPADAPSYMVAWAIGDYSYIDLGTTSAGTQIGVWHLPDGAVKAERGTRNLRAAIDWFETTYGAYIFGDEMASVAVEWGAGMYGGMEHHPFWHVAVDTMSNEATQIHEAAHGWFGDGIRIACWEDFVLSEGTVCYLTARAFAAVAGPIIAEQIWASYQTRLNRIQSGTDTKIAWPEGCGEVDILADGLFSDAPYIKGAYFFLALERRIGAAAVDAALTAFYAEYAGEAATMTDLLTTISAETGYDATDCALAWLRSEELPAETTCPEQ